MDAASPKFNLASTRDGSSLRSHLDVKASSTEPSQGTPSSGFLVEDRVEIGEESLPFRKPRLIPKSPLRGFFEKAREYLQAFLDASKEAKAAKKAEEEERGVDVERPSSTDKETKAPPEEKEQEESSLQDIFKKREAEEAYKLKR